MENNFKDMSNAELKLCLERFTNEFEAKKRMVLDICEEMNKIETNYLKAKHEIEIRQNIFN